MSFAALIAKNLLRQRVRTALTVLGISIGITTVVALGVVVGGLKQTAGQMLRAYNSDFIVARKGTADLSLSTVTEKEAAALAARPDVERAISVLFDITQVGDNPYFITFGIRPEEMAPGITPLVDGRLLAPGAPGEIMLGDRGASNLDATVGATVSVNKREFTVVGIYHTGNTWQDSGAMAPLATLQEVANKPGTLTAVYVTVKPGQDPDEVAQRIRDDAPLLTTVRDVSQMSEVDQGIELMDALNLAISALAVGIGALGVMNTMVMSVFERTREIGILRAVGWRGSRIIRMIIGESLILCMLAAIVGSGLGVLAVRGVMLIPAVQSLLEPQYTVAIFTRALAVAGVVALAGAAYPAIRALRLTPMEALRHE